MNYKKSIIFGVVGIVFVAAFITYLKKPASSIKIGYVGPLTGPVGASSGESIYRAFQIATQDRPEGGGKMVEVIYEDDACDPKKAVSAGQKLLHVDHVRILVSGLCSGSTLALAPLAKEANAILVSPASAAPSITGTGTFRLAASSVTAGKVVANYLKAQGYKKVAILFETNEYPVGWKDSVIKEYAMLSGGDVVAEGAPVGSTDVRSQLLKLAEQKPDILLITTLTAPMANAALNQYRELNLQIPLMGNETFSLQAVIHNSMTEGMLVSAYRYDAHSSAFQLFLSKYTNQYRAPIQEEIYGALAYDTYQLLLDAIDECRGDQVDCLKDYLHSIHNREGLSGALRIDSFGDAQREFVLKRIVQGKAVDL